VVIPGSSGGISRRSVGELVSDGELLNEYVIYELILDSVCKFVGFTPVTKDAQHGVIRGGVLQDDPHDVFH
jgi:hypothetical protein